MNKEIEKISLKGIFQLKIYKQGVLVDEFEESNLIVDNAKIQLSELTAGQVINRHITKIAFGTNSTEPDPSDSIITDQYAKPISSFSYPENGRVQFNWELGISENNGMAIMEFGLLSENGSLFARKSRMNAINKGSDISLEGSWTIIF